MINITGFTPVFINDSKIKVEESKKMFYIENKNKNYFCKIAVDSPNCPVNGIKCDYFFYKIPCGFNITCNTCQTLKNCKDINIIEYIFVELKGVDIEHAFEQILNTGKYILSNEEIKRKNKGFIIHSHSPSLSSKMQNLLMKYKKNKCNIDFILKTDSHTYKP